MNNDLETKLKELKKGYLLKLGENFSSFKALIDETPINIQEVYSKVHTISGTSGMYGLKDLSEASTEFEFYLKPLKEDPNIINIEELKKYFSNYLTNLEKTISKGE